METKTLEQLKADADAARAALEAAEREAAEAQRVAERAAAEKKARAERAARYPKQLEIARAVATATSGALVEPSEECRGDLYHLPHVKCGTVTVSLEAQYAGGSTWSRGRWTGGYTLSIGHNYKTLPGRYLPLKSGGYNYEKLAAKVAELVAAEAAAQKARQVQAQAAASADELVAALRAELGLDKYDGFISSDRWVQLGARRSERYVPAAGKVFLNLSGQFTPEQVRAIHAALKATREVK